MSLIGYHIAQNLIDVGPPVLFALLYIIRYRQRSFIEFKCYFRGLMLISMLEHTLDNASFSLFSSVVHPDLVSRKLKIA